MSERDRLELEADEDARAEAGFLGEDDVESTDEYNEYLDSQRPDEAELAEMLDAMEFEDRINGGE